MGTDRELLELAARAAGIEITLDVKSELGVFLADECAACRLWNPLEDDGDALRLAVKLRIDLRFCKDDVDACSDLIGCIAAPYGNDEQGGTRRAIVRAAAEIGKTMA